MSRPLTILFSGMLAGDPGQGGATWAVLQYVLGFQRLGHDVYFVEPVTPEALEGPPAGYFRRVVRQFRLGGRAALLARDGRRTVGLPYADLADAAARADVLFNVSGMLRHPDLLDPVPARVYLDLDPAFVQLWHAVDGVDMRFAAHTHHVTVGLNIGTPACGMPTCGLTWHRTLPPVVLDHWPAAPIGRPPPRDEFTTIANWRAYGSIHHAGVHYGQKAHSLRAFIDLPRRTPVPLALALAIHPGDDRDAAALRGHGWRLLDPASAAGSPGRYRRFVRGSRAELGVAKSGYVVSRSGWFSDRSACYLASGRPVVAQETGFSDHLPTGEGLLSFADAAGAAGAIARVAADYARHAVAARRLAEAHFDSDRVLARLLAITGVTS